MDMLGSRPDNDQPFTHAISNAGKDCVYIGNNDFDAAKPNPSQTATGDGTGSSGSLQSWRLKPVPRPVRRRPGPSRRPCRRNCLCRLLRLALAERQLSG